MVLLADGRGGRVEHLLLCDLAVAVDVELGLELFRGVGDDGTRLRDGDVVDPEVHAGQLRLPLDARHAHIALVDEVHERILLDGDLAAL